MVWTDVLRAWFESAGEPRGSRYRGRDGKLVYLDERIERLFELDEGRVAGCLHVIDGRPTQYGVAVDRPRGQISTK
jgi:hypothetical protein